MASTTIHTLSYKMVADTQNFTRGLISSKSEIAALKKLMGDTSPEEKAEKALEMLKKLYDNGKISAEKYSHATAQVEAELKQVQFAATRTAKAIGLMRSGMTEVAAAAKSGVTQLAAMAGSYLSIQAIASNIADQINRIDKIQDLAESLDTSANSLLKMQYALQRGGGLGVDEAAAAMKIFSINISNAANGIGKALPTLERMGFEADTLAALNFTDPATQMRIIGDELAKMQEPADRLAAIVKLFGTGGDKLAAFFGGGATAIDEMVRRAERFGIAVSDIDSEKIAEIMENFDEMTDAWAGFGTVLARDVMPTVTAMLKLMTRAIESNAIAWANPDMGGLEPLSFMQRMKMNMGIKEAPIGVAGYDIIFGNDPTAEQKAAFTAGQAKRGATLLGNEVGDAPVIGKYLQRLIDIGERQLEQKDNRNVLE
jgi:methyl-accepting chemotaxis protein